MEFAEEADSNILSCIKPQRKVEDFIVASSFLFYNSLYCTDNVFCLFNLYQKNCNIIRAGFKNLKTTNWNFLIGVCGWVPRGIIFQLKNK